MSAISIKVDYVRNLNPQLGKSCVKASNVKSGISSIKGSLEGRVANRRSIGSRLTSAYQDAARIEAKINQLQSFINQSVSSYSYAENRVSHLAPQFGLKVVTASDSESSSNHEKKSLWGRITGGIHAVAADAKHTFSKVKDAFEPGGSLYKEFQIGKAVLGIGIGVIAVVGSGAGAILSGGTASPLAIATAIYGINDIISSSSDLVNAVQGDYNRIGKVNPLQGAVSGLGGMVGSVFGYEKQGKAVGNVLYHAGSAVTFTTGAYGMIKDIRNLTKVRMSGLTNEVKTIVPNIKRVYSRVGQDVNALRGVRQFKKALNPGHLLEDVKNVKKVQDISSVRAVQKLKSIDYTKTFHKTVKIIMNEPAQKLAQKTTNMVNAVKGAIAIKDSIESPGKVQDMFKDFKGDYKGLTPN